MVYAIVTALNGIPLESSPAVSNGVLIDTTPPESAALFEMTDANIVANPSFEDDFDSYEDWATENENYEMESETPHDGLRYIYSYW